MKRSNMSDLEQQIQVEQQRLYEIASLTDEMVDSDANVLLEWGSAQVPQLAGDGSQLEHRAKKLRRLVGEMNLFMGKVEGMSAKDIQQELEEVYQAATDLSYPAQYDLVPALTTQLEGQNTGDVLVILIAWLENDSLLTDVLGEAGDD
jgi:hypothetical protein